jgi:SAM-dependent methyltransferase
MSEALDPSGPAEGTPGADFSANTPEALALGVALALRAGRRIPDTAFDRFLPPMLRLASPTYWTPLEVAARAARWFTELNVGSVVDIGSGVGKFCIAAALGTRCSFTGIEQRPRLVDTARNLARLFNLEERVEFVTGSFGRVVTPPADCYYLFNPFGENLFNPDERLSEDANLSHARYLRDITIVEGLLASAPVGTYVMTYNGFGGIIPDDYDEVRIDLELPCVLRMARRERKSPVMLRRAGRGWR